jgi:hypothetical protein
MKNIYEVLADKQNAVVRLRIEVDALRLIAPRLPITPRTRTGRATHPNPTGRRRRRQKKNKWPFKVRNAAPGYLDS